MLDHALRLNTMGNGQTGIALYEFPPICRNVFIAGRRHYLSFPYTYFFIRYYHPGRKCIRLTYTFSELRVGMRRTPLEKLTDCVGSIPLEPGSYHSVVCMGSFWNYPHLTLDGLCSRVIDFYWTSSFQYSSTALPSHQWEKWTKEDPTFILRGEWSERWPVLTILTVDDTGKDLAGTGLALIERGTPGDQ